MPLVICHRYTPRCAGEKLVLDKYPYLGNYSYLSNAMDGQEIGRRIPDSGTWGPSYCPCFSSQRTNPTTAMSGRRSRQHSSATSRKPKSSRNFMTQLLMVQVPLLPNHRSRSAGSLCPGIGGILFGWRGDSSATPWLRVDSWKGPFGRL